MKPLLRYITAPVLSALLLAASFPPLHMHYLAWLALAPLFWSCHGRTPLQAAGRFLLAGWLFHALLLNWLAANVFWAGFRALIGWQLLSLYLGLYWAALGALHAWLNQRWTWRSRLLPAPATCLLPFLWIAMEWCQATFFSGFGWSALGYAQAENLLLLQWAALGGVALLAFILVCVNALAAEALAGRRWQLLPYGLAIIVLAQCLPLTFLNEGSTVPTAPKVAIYQSSFPQLMKWDPDFHLEMLERSVADALVIAEEEDVALIVWPEALVMKDYRTQSYLRLLQLAASRSDAYLFTGAVRRGDGGEHYNSSVLIGPEGEVEGFYDKMHLAPFGEYVPLAEYWPALDRLVPGGAVDAGTIPTVLNTGDRRLGPLICFEVLFGPMAEHLRREGADALVVATNLGWFGFSAAVEQELQVARVRAVETRLPILHAANTGISAVIDPWGRVYGPNASVTMDGRYYRWDSEPPPPSQTIMQRMFAVHPIPEAAQRPPLSVSPWVTPWIGLVVSIVGVIGALVVPRSKPSVQASP